MTYGINSYGTEAYAGGGKIVVRASAGIEIQVYSVESASSGIEIQVTDAVVSASTGIAVQVYEVLSVTQGIQIEVVSTLAVGVLIQINVESVNRSAKVFIEQQIYEEVTVTQGIEIQVTEPTYSAAATIEVQVFDVASPSSTIEFQIFDHTAVSSIRWEPRVSVGGVNMSDRLYDSVNITYTENASATANFTMRPLPGPVDVFAYVGQRVEIDYIEVDSNGVQLKRTRRFTGVVDKPSFTPDQTKLYFSCTNDLQGRVAKMSREEIDTVLGGLWSPHIFNENASNWQYFNDQLSTVEAIAWIDHSGILRKTDWEAGTVNYTYTDANKIYDTVRVINPDKGDIINRVNINLDFRYDRFIQRNVFYDSGYSNTLCHFLEQNTFPLPTRRMIEQAADGAGWVRMGAIAYKDVWEPSNRVATSTVEGSFQETGYVQCGSETKAWGGDPDKQFCLGASFTLSIRWTKTINEVYTMVVEAPESITANGVRSVNEDYGILAEADDPDWESNYTPLEVVRDVPGNSTTIGLPLVMPAGSEELENGDWMFPADEAEGTGRSAMEEAQVVAMTKARVEILAGHRSRDIVFSLPLDPFVTLAHTVRLNTPTLQATGKTRIISDTMNITTGEATTEVTLASSGSGTVGIITDDPIASTEVVPDYPLTEYDRIVWLPWRLGGRLSSIPYDETWTGYTANYEFDPDDNSRPNPFSPFDSERATPDVNAYPQQFTVDTPDISEGDRQAEIVTTTQTVNVNIPIDELQEVA